MMKTYSAKAGEVTRNWYVVDAANMNLGRLATTIATRLIGKHKPMYTPNIDAGDNVIVVNAAKITVTGNKLSDKKYYRHSGYPGGIKETSLEKLMQTHPERAIQQAVKGMLPKNRLQAPRMARLKVYAGAEHPHAPQNPVTLGETNG
jgi:large subunit ribosomal protein L13